MSINAQRHWSVFDPDTWRQSVHIIGCGATGSKVAVELAKLGIAKHIRLWDGDKVESHNIANQAFRLEDIGKTKVDATNEAIEAACGERAGGAYCEMFTQGDLPGVVFLLTDTMASRKEIWDSSIRGKTELMIETRMGVDQMRVYTVFPLLSMSAEAWDSSWYPDETSEESACGASVSVGPTSSILAGLSVWQFIKAYRYNAGKSSVAPELEVLLTLRSAMLVSREAV